MTNSDTINQKPLVLPALKADAIVVQAVLLLTAAFVLPSLAHLTGLPVRWLLPMHWPVILAGLCYGWRSGALIGIAAPLVSFGIAGMPPAAVVPAMTMELAAYGFIAGFARQSFGLSARISALVSLIGGRVVFLAAALLIGWISTSFGSYLAAAMAPGLPAALLQLLLLPLAADKWVSHRSSNDS
jgi:niacin transporter